MKIGEQKFCCPEHTNVSEVESVAKSLQAVVTLVTAEAPLEQGIVIVSRSGKECSWPVGSGKLIFDRASLVQICIVPFEFGPIEFIGLTATFKAGREKNSFRLIGASPSVADWLHDTAREIGLIYQCEVGKSLQ